MYRLFKLLLFINPFRLLSLVRGIGATGYRFKLLAILCAGAVAASPSLLPGWLTSLVEHTTGVVTQTTEGQESQGLFGTIGDTLDSLIGRVLEKDARPHSSVAASPVPESAGGYSTPASMPAAPQRAAILTRGELFAAFAAVRLRPDQIQRLPESPAPLGSPPENIRWLRIDHILDGDTLSIGGETVRLIGIDAPESEENERLFRELDRIGARNQSQDMQWLGREAVRFVKQAEGLLCWLEYDEQTKDRFGRTLAYVHLENGATMNEIMLYQGYAKAYLDANFRYKKRYIQLQEEAMTRRHGFWGER